MRVVVCVFGVLARSIHLAWPSVIRRILRPLRRDGHSVYIVGFNLDVGDASAVDGVRLNHSASQWRVNRSGVAVARFDAYNEVLQTKVDAEIDRICPGLACQTFDDYVSARTLTVRNAFRQLHSEMRVGQFLRINVSRGLNVPRYDVAIVLGPDFHFAMDVEVADVRRAAAERGAVFTADMNDADGYTNGFYIGHPQPLSRIMSRFYTHTKLMALELGQRYDGQRFPHNYEVLLRRAFVQHNIQRLRTSMVFFKIRANGHPFWYGAREKQLDALNRNSQRTVLREWGNVVERLCAVEDICAKTFCAYPCLCGNGHVRFGFSSTKGHTWTRWRPVNTHSLFTPVKCGVMTFGKHPWTSSPTHKRICQCRLNVTLANAALTTPTLSAAALSPTAPSPPPASPPPATIAPAIIAATLAAVALAAYAFSHALVIWRARQLLSVPTPSDR